MKLTGPQLSKAFELASARDALPSALSSAEARDAITRSMRERALVLARVSNAQFVSEVKQAIDAHLTGGNGTSQATLIRELQTTLTQLGYTPEKGFPGDEALGIPPAEPGSIRDLSSQKRLELIIKTETQLAHGKAQQLEGTDAQQAYLFPAWELVRYGKRRVPRNWVARWQKAGGPPAIDGRRLIALKSAPIWAALGSTANFEDALDTDTPPFAINSGKGWRPVSRAELIKLGIEITTRPMTATATSPEAVLPPAPVNTATMDGSVRARLLAAQKTNRERLATMKGNQW